VPHVRLEKEQKRRTTFRWIRDKFEGALGGVGFIFYLAVIGAVLYGIYLAFPIARDFVAAKIGFAPSVKASENPGTGPNESAPKSP
jgi:hypothetical protein